MNLMDFGALLGSAPEEVLSNRQLKSLGKWTRHRQSIGLPESRCHSKEAGVELRFARGIGLELVFLHSEGHEKFSQFRGELIGGVTFATDRKALRKKLGKPTASREQIEDSILGIMGAWDGYLINGLAIQFIYSPVTGSIEHVIIEKPGTRVW